MRLCGIFYTSHYVQYRTLYYIINAQPSEPLACTLPFNLTTNLMQNHEIGYLII